MSPDRDLGRYLDESVYPALFYRLDVAFPTFGWERRGNQWTATIWPADFPQRAEDKRPDRLVCYPDRPWWVKVHGHGGIRFLDLVNGGRKPNGPDFPAAVRALCERASVPFPELAVTPEVANRIRERELRRVMLDTVIAASQRELLTSSAGERARAYLAERGFTEEDVADLGFGLYPDLADVRSALAADGHDLTLAIKIGVLWSKMTGYILIPWADANGQPLTLYGRWPSKTSAVGRPKTMALPGEGTKSSPLYFDRARRAGERHLIAVEGVFDAALLQRRGDRRVIAYVAAQFSGEQVQTLMRHKVAAVTICPDPDGGGDTGARSSVKSLRTRGIDCYVAPRLPDGLDPDEFLLRDGIAAWTAHVRQAVTGTVHEASIIFQNITPDSPDPDVRAALSKLADLLKDLPGPSRVLDQDQVLRLAADRTGLSMETLRDFVGTAESGGPSGDAREGWEGAAGDDINLPRINVADRPLRDKTADALRALVDRNDPPNIFVRAGQLSRIIRNEDGRPVIDVIGEHELRHELGRAADFVTGDKHVSPPIDVVRDLLALGEWPFPPLQTIVEAPVLRADGSVLDRAGYDPPSRVHYDPAPGLTLSPVPATPSRADVEAAVVWINELIVDFPFVDEASRANATGLLITPIVRPMIQGNIPLGLLDKPGAGTGASLLGDVISDVATGRKGAMMGAPNDDEEWRKQITSMLLDGSSFILIDNVDGRFRSPALARALTASTWKDRLLGKNTSVELPQRAVWLASGNNLRIGGDLARRSFWIRMDAKVARPYLRDESQFRHPLPEWAIEHRGDLLGAILTIARGWVVAGRPQAKTPTIGGFTEWARTIGGILAFAGIDGFLANASDLYDLVDEDASAWDAFLAGWFDTFDTRPVKVSEIETEVRRDGSPLREALPPDLLAALEAKKFAMTLGYALRSRRDQVIGDFRLEQSKLDEHRKVARWRVVRGIPREKTQQGQGSAGDAGNGSTLRDARARNGSGGETSPPFPASPAIRAVGGRSTWRG